MTLYKNRIRATIAFIEAGKRAGFAESLGGGWFKVRGIANTQGLLHLSQRLEARGWIKVHPDKRAEVCVPARLMTRSDDDAR